MITINYFITNYNMKVKNSSLQDNELIEFKFKTIENILHPIKYISFNKKQEIAKKIIKSIAVRDENRKIIYNSCDKYYRSITTLLSEYTDLKIEDDSFDLLLKNDILPYIVSYIGKDYEVALGVIDMYMDDILSERIQLESL